MRHLPLRAIIAVAAAAMALVGCGSAATPQSPTTSPKAKANANANANANAKAKAKANASASTTASTANSPPVASELPAAEHPRAALFPPTRGRTLQQIAALAVSSAQLGAATGTFTPGNRRLAFGLSSSAGAFIYAPTALYMALAPGAPAQGPFLAPADPMTVAPRYRSAQNAGPGGVQAIYAAQVPVAHKGTYVVLALTRTPRGLIGSPGEIAVAASSPIPDVGQRPPAVATDTAATVHRDRALLSTRTPPEDMHAVSFDQVLGTRPVALLFSTPQLCVSRVCGPVTDIAVSLEHQFAGRIAFIHEEVYVNNQPSQGLRPQLKAFHLETEPWLFTVNRRGVIAARLEGAFGVNAVTQALEAALR